MSSAEYMASLNKQPKIADYRKKEAEKNAEQAVLMKELEKEGWEEEEEEEEEEEFMRRQQTNNPKTPGDEEERKTKKRKQKESAERKEGV